MIVKIKMIIFTAPNVLTVTRILLVPILTIVFYVPFQYDNIVEALIFLFAACTDWLDGLLARYFHQTTELGAFLDQIADKLIVSTALILLMSLYPYSWVGIPAIIIICREIIVSNLREQMYQLGQSSVVRVSLIGKVKTIFQMFAIFLLILRPHNYNYIWIIFGFFLLYASVFLTLYSMSLYLYLTYHSLKKKFI